MFNKMLAERLYNEMKEGQKRVVLMEEFEGSNKRFIEQAKLVGFTILINGYSIVIQK